jgi:hypothetical protein
VALATRLAPVVSSMTMTYEENRGERHRGELRPVAQGKATRSDLIGVEAAPSDNGGRNGRSRRGIRT